LAEACYFPPRCSFSAPSRANQASRPPALPDMGRAAASGDRGAARGRALACLLAVVAEADQGPVLLAADEGVAERGEEQVALLAPLQHVGPVAVAEPPEERVEAARAVRVAVGRLRAVAALTMPGRLDRDGQLAETGLAAAVGPDGPDVVSARPGVPVLVAERL